VYDATVDSEFTIRDNRVQVACDLEYAACFDSRVGVQAISDAVELAESGVFTVYRPETGATNGLDVHYTLSGTASNGVDYGLLTGTVTIPNGALWTTVDVAPLVDDLNAEADETVILTLTADSDYSIGSAVSDFLVISNTVRVPAFPDAEGFGMWTTGGRGGDVYIVSTTNDSGPGSLRAAIDAVGPRTVVFETSGTIFLDSNLVITNSDITIAGQTAPGDGICLADFQLEVRADNVNIRYIRIRPGDNMGLALDSVSVISGHNVIIDHCSMSWSVDETMSVSPQGGSLGALQNVTVQWCMITESLNNSVHDKGGHGYASLIRGDMGASYSYHHNLFAHHYSRAPRPGNYQPYSEDPVGLLFDFRNNVLYNWDRNYAGYNADSDSVSRYNFINNYYVRGSNSDNAKAFNESCSRARAYFAGNYMDHVLPGDPWSLVSGSASGGAYRQTNAFAVAAVSTESAPAAYSNVLAHAGASFARDSVDSRVVTHVINETGSIINDEDDVGGWPVLQSTPAPTDTDRDGMPDAWETSKGLNPADPADRNGDLNGDGYSNLEAYINGLLDQSELIVHIDSSRGGQVTPSSDVVLASGASTNILISADPFWSLGEILLNGNVQPLTNDFLLPTVQSNSSVQITFDPDLTVQNPTPHWWLDGHGLVDFETAVTNDPDGDGVSTWSEYLGGTDPTNASSFLAITYVTRTDGTNWIEWLGGDTNLPPYRLYISTNLMAPGGGFTLLTSNAVRSATGTNMWSDPVPEGGAQRFYRVEAAD